MSVTFVDFINNLIKTPSLLITTILISAVMFINGCSDVPNAIATCVSTRSLTPKKALILASIFNFLGVLIMTFISSKVAETVFNIVNFGDNSSNDKAKVNLYDCIILDVMMPIMDGFEVVKNLRKINDINGYNLEKLF